jgi:hypothetical protein
MVMMTCRRERERERERDGNLETPCLIPLFIPFARPGDIWNLPVFTVYTYYLQGNVLFGASLHAAQCEDYAVNFTARRSFSGTKPAVSLRRGS